MASSPDPLARPVWSALAGPQARFAIVDGPARRLRPDIGLFAAAEDASGGSLAALGRLAAAHGEIGVVEAESPPPVPGAEVVLQAACWQMTAERPEPPHPQSPFDIVALGETDAAEMLALARLTRPGPFFAHTHELGRFIGIRVEGQLAAMAGERLRPEGFTEVSGVCTHPDARGRGYASALMRKVAVRIIARGETPFLHAYKDRPASIALYERLGYQRRRELLLTVLRSV